MFKMASISTQVLVKSSIIIASIIAIYFSDLSIIFSNALEFSAGNLTNYILLIPLIIAFILYRKRILLIGAASFIDKRNSKLELTLGVTLTAIAIFLYIISSSTLYALEYHMYSLPLFVAGATILLFNLKTLRYAIFPIMILVYLQPPPGEFVADLAADLSWISASLTQNLLSMFGMPITLEASYGAPALMVEKEGTKIPFYVGEPSSGVYSIIGLSLFGLFVAYIVKGILWKRISIFILGLPIFFMLNVLRIATILVLWYNYGYEVSETFHAISGMVMAVVGTIAILAFSDKVMRMNIRLLPITSKPCSRCNEYHSLGEKFCLFCGRLLPYIARFDTKDIGRMMLAILILSSALIAQTSTASEATPKESKALSITDLDISTIEGPETTEYFLPQIDKWELRYAYRDERIESVLNQDAALAFVYRKNLDELAFKPSVYVGIQISTGRHTWEDSMVIHPSKVGRPTATVIELKGVDVGDKEGRFFVYKRPNSNLTEAVLYWFERVPLRFSSNFEQRNVQIVLWSYADSLAKWGLINGTNDLKGIEDLYLSLAMPIKEHWDMQYATLLQEDISARLIEQSPILMALMVSPSLLVSLYHYTNRQKINIISDKLYKRLSFADKALIDAIKSVELPTTENILDKYKELTKTSISYEELINKLLLAKDNYIITNDVINIDDMPKLIWKALKD